MYHPPSTRSQQVSVSELYKGTVSSMLVVSLEQFKRKWSYIHFQNEVG